MVSPDQPSNILIVDDDKGRRSIVLDQASYSIGRDQTCDIRLSSKFVSRHHATLVRVQNSDATFSYKILDGTPQGQPSSNGILINGRKLPSYDLVNGDEIVFGPRVQAIYYYLERDSQPTIPPDPEWDITLLSPNMVGQRTGDSDKPD